MAKWQNDAMLDAALNYVADNGAQIDIVSDTATPTDLTNSLASASLTTGAGNGVYSILDGDTSGRKLVIAEQTGLDVTASGDANHVVISDGVGTLLLITTCTTQTLTSGNKVDIPAFEDEIADAS